MRLVTPKSYKATANISFLAATFYIATSLRRRSGAETGGKALETWEFWGESANESTSNFKDPLEIRYVSLILSFVRLFFMSFLFHEDCSWVVRPSFTHHPLTLQVRNLSLFEPRFLRLFDQLKAWQGNELELSFTFLIKLWRENVLFHHHVGRDVSPSLWLYLWLFPAKMSALS